MKIKYDYLYAVEYSKPDLMDESGYKYVIPGLYAAGTESMGVLLSETTGYIDYGGIDHGWCLTSGKLAGENAAQFAMK